MQTRLSRRSALRDTGMSLLAAAIISVMISTTLPPAWRVNVILYGTLIGFVINFYCQLFHIGYRRWSARRGRETSRIVLAALYFVGGVLGWLTATAIAVWIGLTPARLFRSLAPYFVPIAGVLAIVIGLLFYTWRLMEERLRKSIERIKEHEFAEKELELAREIQQRLLPPQEVEGDRQREHVEVANRDDGLVLHHDERVVARGVQLHIHLAAGEVQRVV